MAEIRAWFQWSVDHSLGITAVVLLLYYLNATAVGELQNISNTVALLRRSIRERVPNDVFVEHKVHVETMRHEKKHFATVILLLL